MCTGTDEHGLKIQRVAEARGVPPKDLCDGVSERFRVRAVRLAPLLRAGKLTLPLQELARAANIDHQIFIRTTEARHRTAVEHVWVRPARPLSVLHPLTLDRQQRELKQRGYIYKSSYSGWYAVSDEAYVPEVVDPKSGEKYMVRRRTCILFHPLVADASHRPQASTETGTRVEWMEEENYKFRLSAFKEPLHEWLSSVPNRASLLSPPALPSRSS